ncbi:ABC transporter permease [Paenibacillus illinoisensis]|uniref:ABC transporter permease n=1 Tax=Paenibacillus illinoisensis TaxID=59845 RepID=A0ABW8HTG2_9BACL
MRTYLEVIKITIKNAVVHKFHTAISILTSIFTLLVQILLWKMLLSTSENNVVSFEEMITYQTVGVLLGIIYNGNVAYEVGNKVRDGSISLALIKPYSFSSYMFANTIGSTLIDMIIRGVSLLAFVAYFYSPAVHLTTTNVMLLAIVIPMNFLMFWLLHYIIGLLYFVFISANWFVRILKDTILVFSGAVIPLWYFPDTLRTISEVLPFQLLYQFPQSLLINKISEYEIIRNISLECTWIIVLTLAAWYLWSLGIRKLVIQGG